MRKDCMVDIEALTLGYIVKDTSPIYPQSFQELSYYSLTIASGAPVAVLA